MNAPPEQRDPAGRVTLDLVLMSDPGWPTDIAHHLKADLVGLLSGVRADVDWRVSVSSSALALAAQADPPSMVRPLTEQMHGRMWDLALFVTDLPYRANARPVVLMLSRPERVPAGILIFRTDRPGLGAYGLPTSGSPQTSASGSKMATLPGAPIASREGTFHNQLYVGWDGSPSCELSRSLQRRDWLPCAGVPEQ